MFREDVVESEVALALFRTLRDSVVWEKGRRSKIGVVSTPIAIDLYEYPQVMAVIRSCLDAMADDDYVFYGAHFHYYMNGEMYLPSRFYKDLHTLVISLGETRLLQIGEKYYSMVNGSAILLKSESFRVLTAKTTDSTINIMVFMQVVQQAACGSMQAL
jgi:hypothetical protein